LKKKRATALALAAMLFTSTAPGIAAAESYSWKLENNNWYYLTSTGKTVTGWVLYNKNWYYLGSNGVMKTGWLWDGKHWYFLDLKSGVMKTGWLKENNIWYFLDSSGAMKTGWVLDKGTWYYLQNNGAMKTGWVDYKGDKYFLQSSGAMLTGQKMIDGKPYQFDTSGTMTTIKGWFVDGSVKMYFDVNGVMHKGWLLQVDKKYYFGTNGQIVTGWLTLGDKKYYFANDGVMQKGMVTVGNKKYYFNTDGIMQMGWITIDGKKYYLGTDGVVKTGWLLSNGFYYYFSVNGEMQTGWITDAGKKYYLNTNGIMATGWINLNNKWYFLNSSGAMQIGWLWNNNAWYYLNQNGERQIGWITVDGATYYLDADGKMVTGKQVIDGKTYTFLDNGALDTGPMTTQSTYNVTLQQMIDTQMKYYPQTDKYKNSSAYVSKDYILLDENDTTIGLVTGDGLNVREEMNTSSHIFGSLNQGDKVPIVSLQGDWYEIKYTTWRNAKKEDVAYYVDPSNVSPSSAAYFQFLLLSRSAGTTANELNAKILSGKGILDGKGDAFIQASKTHNINEIYLISHALLETGNGTSALASGKITVSMVDGKQVEPKVVYNMYGVGAIDSCPNTCGAEYAYKQGWFTPEAAIIGGASFIGQKYINDPYRQQDTLYKMRWNPANPGVHQYATDIGWAAKQVTNIKKIYDLLDSYTLYYDVPVFK
jgi:glucan-binding YG repeat protein/beta-N-acetylglucosaminidase